MTRNLTLFSLLFALTISVFIRLYNLSHTSRFIWDESRALVDMHRIWELKQITFVGPISENNLEMFPSLTYYLLLPTTILSKFDPLGPVYTMIILGLITWGVATYAIIRRFGFVTKTLFLSALLSVSFPLVLTSRWAWNPNPIIFWTALSLFFLFLNYSWSIFFAGLFIGLNLYHHYLSLLSIIPMIILFPLLKFTAKKNALFILGFFISMLPFLIFEANNHYYQSWFSLTKTSNLSLVSFPYSDILARLWSSVTALTQLFLPEVPYANSFFLIILILSSIFSFRHSSMRYLSLVIITGFLFSTGIRTVYPHYLYVLVPPILILISYFALKSNKFLILIPLLFLVVSAYKTISYISTPTWEGDIEAIRNTTKALLSEPATSGINVAALQSSDNNVYGQRYRDMALIHGKTLDSLTSYDRSRVLYVVSTSNSPDIIRQDQAYEFRTFASSKLTNQWVISSYPYYLYRFEKQ